jgi:predicted HicB family RNase H-like nuclease
VFIKQEKDLKSHRDWEGRNKLSLHDYVENCKKYIPTPQKSLSSAR